MHPHPQTGADCKNGNHHRPLTASSIIPGNPSNNFGNISGNNSGNNSGNKIGKTGNRPHPYINLPTIPTHPGNISGNIGNDSGNITGNISGKNSGHISGHTLYSSLHSRMPEYSSLIAISTYHTRDFGHISANIGHISGHQSRSSQPASSQSTD